MKSILKLHPFCMLYGHNFILIKNQRGIKNPVIICKTCKANFKYDNIVQDLKKENGFDNNTVEKIKNIDYL